MQKKLKWEQFMFAVTLTWSIILEYAVRHYDLWNISPYTDSVMHFFWGVNIFFALVIFFKWDLKSALLGIFVWQMFWEALEMVGDVVTAQPGYMLDHFFFDGIKDTIVDVLGGVCGWLLIGWTGVFKGTHSVKHLLWMQWYMYSMLPSAIVGGIILFMTGTSADMLATVWILLAAAGTILVYRIKQTNSESHRKKK